MHLMVHVYLCEFGEENNTTFHSVILLHLSTFSEEGDSISIAMAKKNEAIGFTLHGHPALNKNLQSPWIPHKCLISDK